MTIAPCYLLPNLPDAIAGRAADPGGRAVVPAGRAACPACHVSLRVLRTNAIGRACASPTTHCPSLPRSQGYCCGDGEMRQVREKPPEQTGC